MSYETFVLRLIIGVCPTPSDPRNGKVGQKVSLDKRFLDGDEATFSCNRGYDLIGKKKLRCVGKVWDFGEPECKGENVPALLNTRYPLRNIFASMTGDRLN